jgi:hypothetical protein
VAVFAGLSFIIYAAVVVKVQGSVRSARLLKEHSRKDPFIHN